MKREFMKDAEIENLIKRIEENYGIKKNVLKDFSFLKTNNRIFIVKKETREKIEYICNKVKVDRVGFYLGRIERTKFRLSFDATQFFAKHIKKFIEINDEKAYEWFSGKNIQVENKIIKETIEENNFVVLKNREDFIGCGYFKSGKIKNFVPKERREKQRIK